MVDQRGFDNQPWVDAHTAAKLLGVQRRTLYAYVARGLLRSAPGERGKQRRYDRGDLERLAVRHRARAGHAAVASGALRFGEPVLDSAVSTIDARGPVYRGVPAVELAARGVGYERAAELLWTGALPEEASWPRERAPWPSLARLVPDDASPGAALPIAVALLALRPLPARAELDAARALLPALAAIAGPDAGEGATVAAVLAGALGRKSREVARGLDAALILMADHELNASTFTARVTASTGAALPACLAAALAACSGPRHGGMSLRVEALADEARTADRAARTLRDRIARGDELPGYGHLLYPDGDPRCPPMLELARAIAPKKPRVATVLALAAAGPSVVGHHATCDLGLVALAAALGLPRGAPTAIFAIGRCAGWVAHIVEQRAAGYLIRPRASMTP